MGKASNFVSTDATKRRKQIANVANKFVLLEFFLIEKIFFVCLLLKNTLFLTSRVWKNNQFLNEVLHCIFRELL